MLKRSILPCLLVLLSGRPASASTAVLDKVAVAKDGRGFVLVPSGTPFIPWGFNYGNSGRLIEDFWDADWKTLAADFADMKRIGANVVRVHLQLGKFMDAPDKPNERSLQQLGRLLELSEQTGLYLDLTGLACYRTKDVPPWYDALDEEQRWAVQACFWEAVAGRCCKSPAVFCYDLMNEPLSPGGKRKPGQWYSGTLFGGYDFLQWIALDQRDRPRDQIARQWIQALSAAIRRKDHDRLITVGLLPSTPQWGHLSGFVPDTVAPELDFVSVHIYPEKGKVPEAIATLKQFAVKGKPLVVEETFPLSCPASELKQFLVESKSVACGWVAHYNGESIEALEDLRRAGKITIPQLVWLEGLCLFRDAKAEMVDDRAKAPAARPPSTQQ